MGWRWETIEVGAKPRGGEGNGMRVLVRTTWSETALVVGFIDPIGQSRLPIVSS